MYPDSIYFRMVVCKYFLRWRLKYISTTYFGLFGSAGYGALFVRPSARQGSGTESIANGLETALAMVKISSKGNIQGSSRVRSIGLLGSALYSEFGPALICSAP